MKRDQPADDLGVVAKPGAARAADDVEVEMPIMAQYRAGVRERLLFDVENQNQAVDVEVRQVVRGRERVESFRLADDATVLEVRLDGSAATIIGPGVDVRDYGPTRVDLSADGLADLARLLSAWLEVRREWAAYVGSGTSAKFGGYWPLVYYAPGAASGERIERSDARLDALRAAPGRLRLVDTKSVLGGQRVDHELRSGADDPVGVVVHGLAEGVMLLARGAAVLGAHADPARLLALGWHVATGGEGVYPADVRGMAGVIVCPDAVEVIAQSARALRA